MVEKYISTIYERTNYIIKSCFVNESEKMLALYKEYLTNKYESQLTDIIKSESEEMVNAVIETFIEDELRIWAELSETEMMSIL